MPSALRFSLSLLLAGMISWTAPVRAADVNDDYNLGVQRREEGDMVTAMTILRKAADQGHVKAMVELADILDASEFDEEAVAMYRKAAELGDLDGMVGLGVMTAGGEGITKDPLEGRRWIQKAAEQGHTQAIDIIAQAFLKGELGLGETDRNTPEALRWVQLAAKKDFLPAVDALAEAYRTGTKLGVAADPVLAAEYVAQGNKLRGIDLSKAKKKGKKAPIPQPAKTE